MALMGILCSTQASTSSIPKTATAGVGSNGKPAGAPGIARIFPGRAITIGACLIIGGPYTEARAGECRFSRPLCPLVYPDHPFSGFKVLLDLGLSIQAHSAATPGTGDSGANHLIIQTGALAVSVINEYALPLVVQAMLLAGCSYSHSFHSSSQIRLISAKIYSPQNRNSKQL